MDRKESQWGRVNNLSVPPTTPEGPCSNIPIIYLVCRCDNPADGIEVLGGYPDPETVEWLDWELDGAGNVGELLTRLYDGDVTKWMLIHGIAPTQEFLVRVGVPSYSQDYWGEWDSTPGEVSVVAVEPMTTERSSLLWMAYVMEPKVVTYSTPTRGQ